MSNQPGVEAWPGSGYPQVASSGGQNPMNNQLHPNILSSPGQVPAASLPDLISLQSDQMSTSVMESPSSNLPVTIHQPSLPTFIHDGQQMPNDSSGD